MFGWGCGGVQAAEEGPAGVRAVGVGVEGEFLVRGWLARWVADELIGSLLQAFFLSFWKILGWWFVYNVINAFVNCSLHSRPFTCTYLHMRRMAGESSLDMRL